jgi:methylated-DNA-[protein]-cysteine S-methyltransferase
MNLFIDRMMSPIGTILMVWDGLTLRALDFSDYESRMEHLLQLHYGSYQLMHAPAPAEIRNPIEAYFEGVLTAIDCVRVQTHGTLFQQQVWTALREIPTGKTMTYSKLAIQIGKPKACRAVGLANALNPVGIVVPCHRVIGANGALTGYAGGIERKRWLLAHERAGVLDRKETE